MGTLEKYEVLSILGADDRSTSYKIKNKETSEVFVWKAFAYKDPQELQDLIGQLETCRLKQEQPNSLHIYNFITYEDKKVVYATCEFCINGNLANIIQTCRTHDYYLEEKFVWRLLYQLACVLRNGMFEIKLNDVFLDADFNIKLFRFKPLVRNNFSAIIEELCKFGVHNYSPQLNDLVKFSVIGNIVDVILSHPEVLSKNANNTVITDIYVKNKTNEHRGNYDILENLKNREAQLRNLEERLNIKEQEILKREKNVSLHERRLYKRASKVVTPHEDIEKLHNCENALNNRKIVEASKTTTKTMAERRVHFKGFKGHSPLKEISWAKQEVVSNAGSKKAVLFSKARPTHDNSSRPISWTEETKRHAFDLLRLMNKEDVENLPLKHTYL